jgi:uncharacterized protein (DUF1697 family)
MPCFVAFLRGINVGGHVVVKEKLQEVFASLGFQNVSTYKQSGNVIFETNSAGPQEIKTKIEEKLCNSLGFEVAVVIRTIPQLNCIIDLDPFKGQISEGTSFLITFLPTALSPFPLQLPLTIPKSTAQVISSKGAEVFSVTHGGGEGALPNPFLESKLKTKATTRNMNIIRQIVEKYS